MSSQLKSVLLLGGTEEAYRLAEKISQTDWRCLTSLAGITRNPKIPPGELIKGGFGGAESPSPTPSGPSRAK